MIRNANPDRSPRTLAPCRALFIRSHATIGFAAMIAGGLHASPQIEFAQYPPLPPWSRAKLEKFPRSDDAWEDLQRNLITNPAELAAKLSDHAFDVVIVEDYQGKLLRHHQMNWLQKAGDWARAFRRFGRRAAIQRQYAAACPFSVADLRRYAPVAVVDLMDHPYLTIGNLDLLQQCTAYFKRELPYDRLALFNIRYIYQELAQFLGHAILRDDYARRYHAFFSPWKTRKVELRPLTEHVYGIPLGIRDTVFQALTELRTKDQDIDIFWAGEPSNTMRITAINRLRELAHTTNWNIVIADAPMPMADFWNTIARSKLTLSVAGGGWDCFRHCEAVALGSLPIINIPTMDAVWWHGMPADIYFENTFANFTARLEQLLQQAELRQTCYRAVEQLTRKHLLWSQIVEYLVYQTLEHAAGSSEPARP